MEGKKNNLDGLMPNVENYVKSVVAEEVQRVMSSREGIERTYTTAEVCALLHVCRTTLWKRVQAGEITPMKKGGKLLYSEEEIKNYFKGERNGAD